MYFEIKGTVESVTNMHIGGNDDFSLIGGVDNPVIKEVMNGLPYIPGSSFKGVSRSCLAKIYNKGRVVKCRDDDDEKIIRLFGGSRLVDGRVPRGRLRFEDMFMSNEKELKEKGVAPTLVVVQNTIHPFTGVANPRQMECSTRGAEYDMTIGYEVQDESQTEEDFRIIKEMLKGVQRHGIGGGTSRSMGKIRIKDITVESMTEDGYELEEKLQKILEG